MSRTYSLNSVQIQSNIRLASFVFQQAAFRGQVGTGGFVFDDISGLQDLPAMKAFTADESAATPTRFYAGYTAERSIIRGPLTVDTQRQWDVTVEDLNAFLDDRLIGTTGKRSSETDYARVTWLLSEASMTGVSVGVVPNTNTVTMGAANYRHEHPRKVLEDCAQKSGKNFFLYDTGTGYLLWYDLSNSTSLTSTLSISDDPADVDSVTIFGPSSVTYRKDPGRVFSTVELKYTGGVVSVTKAATATTFRQRETRSDNSRVKTAARATELAQKQLDNADSEQITVGCSVSVPAALVTAIRAGMRIQIKLRHAGLTAFTYYRVKTCSIEPRPGLAGVSDVEYLLRLELSDAIRPTHFQTDDPVDDDSHTAEDSTAVTVVQRELEWAYDSTAESTSIGYGNPTLKHIESRIYRNVAWPSTDCGIGLGGWTDLMRREAWYEMTTGAIADDVASIRLTIPAADVNYIFGVAGSRPYVYGYASAAPSTYERFVPLGFLDWVSAGAVVDLPRYAINTAGVTYFVIAPGWWAWDGFFCASELAAGVYGPAADLTSGGEGNSGELRAPVITAKVRTLTAGRGITPWVSANGAINGSNRVFTLIGWNGGGVPLVKVNGLQLDLVEYTVDESAGTVTLDIAPEAIDSVSFRYRAVT